MDTTEARSPANWGDRAPARRTRWAGATRRRLPVFLVAAALALSVVPSAAAAPAPATGGGRVVPAIGIRPHYVKAPKAANAQLFTCQTRVVGDPPVIVDGVPVDMPACYGPDQIRAAYGIQPLLDRGLTGAGRTIVIIDAFASPTISDDLAIFDATWGLPDPVFKIVSPDGVPAFDSTDDNMVGWSAETSLDVEWAHAAAPGAAITLVQAKSNSDADILSATKYAIDHNLGDVISQSFGEAERCVSAKTLRTQHQLFAKATRMGITLVASSGDEGAAQPTCDGTSYVRSASSPASDPAVTGVGGTNLFADDTTGAYQSERAWSDPFSGTSDGFCFPTTAAGCSGGGLSTSYHRPNFQNGQRRLVGNQRGVPDVAYNAGVDGGVLVYWGVGGGFFIFGGTSAGSPQWAGLVAIADQAARHRLGTINDDLYRIAASPRLYRAAFHDVTTGNNTWQFTTATTTKVIGGFRTLRGWDAVTGLGTPIASALVPMLAAGGH